MDKEIISRYNKEYKARKKLELWDAEYKRIHNKYNSEWYYKNREKVLAGMKAKREARLLKELQVKINLKRELWKSSRAY